MINGVNNMPRLKKQCRIKGCKRMTTSLGTRRGKPYYSTLCFVHRKKLRDERRKNETT